MSDHRSGMARPRPTKPARAPGGIVVDHFIDGRLVRAREFPSHYAMQNGVVTRAAEEDLERAQEAIARGADVMWIAYDGDTGQPLMRWWAPTDETAARVRPQGMG